MIRFKCRRCDEPIKVADDCAGRRFKCPGCGSIGRIPDALPELSDHGVIAATAQPSNDVSIGKSPPISESLVVLESAEPLALAGMPVPQPVLAAAPALPTNNPVVTHVYHHHASPAKSKLVAALLAVFCGHLGIHNFYLGRHAIGVIQIVLGWPLGALTCFVTTIIVYVWALIEAIVIFSGGINDANGQPLE